MNSLGYICIVVGLVTLAMMWLTLTKIRQRKLLPICFCGLQSLLLFFLFVSMLLLFSNLNTYYRLTAERDIAEILVKKVSSEQFQLEVVFGHGQTDSFLLNGDEWQIDVRIIKWKNWANLIGLDSYYQLDRISGRYRDIGQANATLSFAHKLLKEERGLSLWKLKRLAGKRLTFLDTYFGQSVFMPMRHLAKYKLSITQSGLVARPANEIANQAMEAW